ncbi:DUF5384 family protein [Enterobacter mori]|uniref:DUF5384 family protein n=1 Tax=Enterobacter mori TaxID=539813 RepID=UPI00398A5338
MTRYSLVAVLLFLSSPTHASPVQSQLSALAQAERQGQQEEQAARDARLAQERAARRRHEQAVIAAQNKARLKQQAIDAEKARTQKKEEAIQDQLIELELQKRKLALEREALRVKRENDFIDAELKERAARADVIQSEADSKRNISGGLKDFMLSKGKAEENEALPFYKRN